MLKEIALTIGLLLGSTQAYALSCGEVSNTYMIISTANYMGCTTGIDPELLSKPLERVCAGVSGALRSDYTVGAAKYINKVIEEHPTDYCRVIISELHELH